MITMAHFILRRTADRCRGAVLVSARGQPAASAPGGSDTQAHQSKIRIYFASFRVILLPGAGKKRLPCGWPRPGAGGGWCTRRTLDRDHGARRSMRKRSAGCWASSIHFSHCSPPSRRSTISTSGPPHCCQCSARSRRQRPAGARVGAGGRCSAEHGQSCPVCLVGKCQRHCGAGAAHCGAAG